MSPLAAAAASGEAAPGASRGHHLPLLRRPAHNCRASAGVFFSDSAFRGCSFSTWELFLPGRAEQMSGRSPCTTQPSETEGEARGAHSPPLQRGKGPGCPPRGAQGGFVPGKLVVPGPKRKQGFPHRSACTRGACGKGVKRGQQYTVVGVPFRAVLSLRCQ